MRLLNLAVVGVSLAIAACGSNPINEQKAALDSATLHGGSLGDLPYRPLAIGKLQREGITIKDPVWEFSNGKSFVAALKIVGSEKYDKLYVAGLLSGDFGTTWFFPAVTVLDGNFHEILMYDQGHLVYADGMKIEFTVSLHGIADEAKYVLVHFPKRAANGHVVGSSKSEGVAVIGETPVATGPNAVNYYIPLSPVGKFNIALLVPSQQFPDKAEREPSLVYRFEGLETDQQSAR